MVCSFFGHRDTPQKILPALERLVIDLIENQQADMFYVGNQGNFDIMAKKTIKKLQRTYPHITYAVVLAYLPGERKAFDANAAYETVYPFGLEAIPPKYAIVKRNRWMIAQSDAVITYVRSSFGGAFQCKAFAEKNGKMVFCL